MTFDKYISEKSAKQMAKPYVLPHAGPAGRGYEINGVTHMLSNKAHHEKCTEWEKNPTVNPFTGKPILKDGPTYKQLKQMCS